MGFVHEQLSESDLKVFRKLKIRSQITSGLVREPKQGVFDRKRNVMLVILEGTGSEGATGLPPIFMALIWRKWWKTRVVGIEAYQKSNGSFFSGNQEVFWRVTRIEIPVALAKETDLILEMIRDALDAGGDGYRPDKFKAVHVSLPDPLFI